MEDLLSLLKEGRLPLFSNEGRRGYMRMNIAGFCATHKEYVRGVVFEEGSDMEEVARHANAEHKRGCPVCESPDLLK